MAGNDSNTVSLLHMDGADGSTTFTDDAAGGTHTWTAVGGMQIDTAQKEFGTASGLSDGVTDAISTPDSADFYFGTGNFTIDFWIRFNSTTGEQWFVSQSVDPYDGLRYWNVTKTAVTHKLTMLFTNGVAAIKGQYIMTNNWSPSANTWYHLAFVRNGTTALIFIDGVSQSLVETVAFGTNDVGDIAGPVYVSDMQNNSVGYNGWMDELRINKGIARWTSNFTPPTSAYSADVVAGGGIMTTRSGYWGDL